VSKKFLFLTILLSFIFAKEIDYNQAKTIAIEWMKKVSNKRKKLIPLAPELSYTNKKIKKPPFYIFNLQGGGWVIVSNSDVGSKVLAYSETSSLNIKQAPVEFRWWLDSVSKILEDTNKAQRRGTLKHFRKLEPAFAVTPKRSSVGPLLKTAWGQGVGYNEECPSDARSIEGNGKVPAGCIAVAMAQIMNYYAWPPKGRGKNSYVPLSHPEYGRLTVDFGNSFYSWKSSEAPKIVYHSGVAVNMDYGPYGSSSYLSSANSALQKYFGYKTSGLIKKGSESVWNTLLINSLDKGHPVLYQGKGAIVHAFVCDGYKIVDDGILYHFNWGWYGEANGWFRIGQITPLSTHSFNRNNYAIFDIRPSDASYNTGMKNLKSSFSPWLAFAFVFLALFIVRFQKRLHEKRYLDFLK